MGADIASILTIGGPSSVITAVLVLLVRAYFERRKDNREEKASDVQTDAGIVDNAKNLIELVRNETDRMELKMIDLERDKKASDDRNLELEKHINAQDDRLARQERDIEWLKQDLEKARAEIRELRNGQAQSGGRDG